MTWSPLQTIGGNDEPNILNKTRSLLQTTGGKDEPNIILKTLFILQRVANIHIELTWY